MIHKGFPGKKVLSLVLCVAVMLSVMVLGAGAAFSDQDQIENTEAVNMCSALNIIGGYEDGSFHPERNIKRSEITKMICVALNGGKEPNLAVPATPTFTDVRDTADGWAEKYIESCVAQGIVSGVGGGRFSPSGNVTGSQLAKMLLVALGYDAELGQFTGTAWETNVNVVATQKGLYEGLESMDVSAAVTRDQAAQMVWNAMQAVEVEYVYTLVSENGQLVSKVTVQDKAQATVGGSKYDYTLLYDKYKALMTDDSYDTVTMTGYKWIDKDNEFEYTFAVTGGTTNTISFSSATDYTDLYAQRVNVVYKGQGDNSVYGIYAADSQVLYTGVASDIEAYDNDSIKIDSVKYKVDDDAGLAGVEYYGENVFEEKTSADVQDYYSIRVIDLDGDGEVDCVVYQPFTVEKVTYVGSTSITLDSGVGSKNLDDINVYEGIAKDDYVIHTAPANTADGKDAFAKVEVITGTVDAVRDTNDVQVSGVWYSNATADYANGSSLSNANLGATVELQVVNGYYFDSKVTLAEADANLLYISAADDAETSLGTATVKATAYFADGSDKTITIDKVNDLDVTVTSTNSTVDLDSNGNPQFSNNYATTTNKVVVGAMYRYTTDSSGNYELHTLADTDTTTRANYDKYVMDRGTKVEYNSNTERLTVGSSTFVVPDDAVVFVQTTKGSNTETKVVSGKALKNWNWGNDGDLNTVANLTAQVLSQTVSGVANAKVMTVVNSTNNASISGADSTAYGYVVATPEVIKTDGTQYQQFVIWNGTEDTTVRQEGTSSNVAKGDFVSYDVEADNEITNLKEISTAYAVTGLSSNDTVLDLMDQSGVTTTAAKIDSEDTTVIYVNTEDVKGVEGGSVTLANEPTPGVYEMNVVADGVSAGNAMDVIFVDVNNKIAGAGNSFNLTTDDALQEALNGGFGTVPFDASKLTENGEVSVPSNTMLDLTNTGTSTLTVNLAKGAAVAVNGGTFTASENGGSVKASDSAVELSNVSITGTADLSEVATSLAGDVTVASGASLKIDANTDGYLPSGNGTLTVAPGGTLTSMTTSGEATATTFVGPTEDARIQTTNGSVEITFSDNHNSSNRHKMTINGNATIPASKTWFAMFDSGIQAQGIDMIVNGTLTVNGELKLADANGTGSSLTIDNTNGSVVVGADGKVTVGSLASLVANNKLTGAENTSTLSVFADGSSGQSLTFTGVPGVTSRPTGSTATATDYTWDTTTTQWKAPASVGP